MSDDGKDRIESLMITAAILCGLALLTLPVGIGFLLGAGAGWLVFALICMGMSYGAIRLAKQVKKEATLPEPKEDL